MNAVSLTNMTLAVSLFSMFYIYYLVPEHMENDLSLCLVFTNVYKQMVSEKSAASIFRTSELISFNKLHFC